MSNKNDIHSSKRGRDNSLREEQALCRLALESGVYDSISDQAWVALCEQVATDARHEAGQGDEKSLLSERDPHRGGVPVF